MSFNTVTYAYISLSQKQIIYEEGMLSYKDKSDLNFKTSILSEEQRKEVENFFRGIQFRSMKSNYGLSCVNKIYNIFVCTSANGKSFKVVYDSNCTEEFIRIYRFLAGYCRELMIFPDIMVIKEIEEPDAWLIRQSTGKKIPVLTNEFKIGKSMNSDCYLMGYYNNVEREHAVIEINQGDYYIKALKKGTTYVDNTLIDISQKYTLENNSKIRLGTEELTFYKNQRQEISNEKIVYRTKTEEVSVALAGTKISIGRRRDSDIHIDNVIVASRQAELVHKEGKWYIVDIGTMNGTYLNGIRLEEYKEYLLEHLDIIKLANRVELQFVKN